MRALPWFLTVVLGGLCVFLFLQNQKQEISMTELRSQLDGLQSDHADLEARLGQADPNELERLRKETDEVYKLRSEVAKLQKLNNELKNELQTKRVHAEVPDFQQTQNVDPTLEEAVPEDPQTKLQREYASQCMQNMSVIEEAKTMWAVANNKEAGNGVTVQDITTALPNGAMPLCPSGGTYNLEQVGVPVSCSIPGHSLLP
jgi:hypothetical protein